MSPDSIKSILTPEPPEPFLRRLWVYRTLMLLATGTLLLDQLSKALVRKHLAFNSYGPGEQIEVIRGFFNIVHVGNTGAAWSILTGRSVLLAVIAALTLVSIFVWRKTLMLKRPLVQLAFGLLCGGILGNLIDRLRFGHVIDFLDFHFGSYVYPTFNIADCGICIGVAFYLWHSLKS